MDSILFPINHGILHFVGFDVLPPFIAWGPAGASAEVRGQYLAEFAERLRQWDTTPPIRYPSLEDYDESFQLKTAAGP
jgi:NAD(P)H dehydrogenase (quinone)